MCSSCPRVTTQGGQWSWSIYTFPLSHWLGLSLGSLFLWRPACLLHRMRRSCCLRGLRRLDFGPVHNHSEQMRVNTDSFWNSYRSSDPLPKHAVCACVCACAPVSVQTSCGRITGEVIGYSNPEDGNLGF